MPAPFDTMAVSRPRSIPLPLGALPSDPAIVCQDGVSAVVVVYPPRGVRPAGGCAFKIYRPAAVTRHRRGKSTLPVADCELQAHLALERALGPEYFRRCVHLDGVRAVLCLDGCLCEADLAGFGLGPAAGRPSAFALRLVYGGVSLSETIRGLASLAAPGRRAFFAGLASVCGTLALFRRRGLMHLDVKAPNILVDGAAFRLADFGLLARAARPGDSILDHFLAGGRCYGAWPLDFYLASPRWRTLGALETLEGVVGACRDCAFTLASAPPESRDLARGALCTALAALPAAAADLFRQAAHAYRYAGRAFYPFEPEPPELDRCRSLVRFFERRARSREPGSAPTQDRELARLANCAAREAGEFARRVRESPDLELRESEKTMVLPFQRQLEPYFAAAARLGVDLLWDGSAESLRRYAAGLEAACAGPGPRGALARLGSGIDVYMMGRTLLAADARGARLPPEGVDLACRMASLDPRLRPDARDAAAALAAILDPPPV